MCHEPIYQMKCVGLIIKAFFFLLIGSWATAQQPHSEQWNYIQIDSVKQKWGDWNDPDWLRYFGLDTGDVDGDGNLDIISGKYIYHNPGGTMANPWPRTVLEENVDGILFLDVDHDFYADIIAMALPDLYWYEAVNEEGTSYIRKKIGQVPATSHVNSQGFEKAQLIPGGPSEFVIAGNGNIYVVAIPRKNAKTVPWKVSLICKNTSDEGIGIGDIDNDSDLDIAAGRRPIGEEEPKILIWFENPGNIETQWKAHHVGLSEHPIDRVKVADVNGDKKADIIVTEERYPGLEPDANIWWFGQQGLDTWERNRITTQYSTNNLDILDIDTDGDTDLLTAEHKGEQLELQLWYNDGKGNFSKTLVDTGKENHLGAQWADLDNDGDMDVIGAGWDKHNFMHVWRNDEMVESLENAQVSEKNKAGIKIRQALYEDRPHFLIHTELATYYLDVSGGGLSRIIDQYGNDWIGFKKEPWDRYPASAAAAFRGMPNLVFKGKDKGAGHPGHDKCTSTITSKNTIKTESLSGLWKWTWNFFHDYVVLNVMETDADIPYWFLYEGTPGGFYDPEKYGYGTNVLGPRRDIPDFYNGNILQGDFQWAYFFHEDVDTTLFVVNMAKDAKTDMMAYLGNSEQGAQSKDGMTVFAFGRDKDTTPLLEGKNTFIIGLYPKEVSSAAEHEKLTVHIQNIVQSINFAND